MLEWIIYYSDGSTFSSKDGGPQKTPRNYVQVVMQTNDHMGGRDLMDYHDHYGWHNDRWLPHDLSGITQYKDDPSIENKIVLNGYWIADSEFWKIHNQALDDPEWKDLQTRMVRGRPCEG
jgi:hypothetical protein